MSADVFPDTVSMFGRCRVAGGSWIHSPRALEWPEATEVRP